MIKWLLTAALLLGSAACLRAAEKVCGVYTSVIDFASRDARRQAIEAQPAFLMEKHKRYMSAEDGGNGANLRLVHDCGFNTLFMTIYPLWGREWWGVPAARKLVNGAVAR